MRSETVVRLVPKRERVEREAAEQVATAIMSLPSHVAPPFVLHTLLNALSRVTAPDTERGLWPGGFVMLSQRQIGAIWDAIRELPGASYPGRVRHAFDLVLLNLRPDTGEVMLTREQLAERMGCDSHAVTKAMGVLKRLGVIMTERRKVEGMRGPGVVAYFINPHAAWNGDLSLRREVADRTEAPLLKLMEGGRADPAP